MTNEIRIPGPAYWAAACPVSTKMPAPMIAPIPRRTRLLAVRVRLSVGPPLPSVSDISCVILFFDHRPIGRSGVEEGANFDLHTAKVNHLAGLERAELCRVGAGFFELAKSAVPKNRRPQRSHSLRVHGLRAQA